MYNTILYNQRPYNSSVDNTGYKTMEFLRGVYSISFTGTKKTLEFVRNIFKLKFTDF